MSAAYPILEFDPSPRAVIEPHGPRPVAPVPEVCVLCFFGEVIRKLGRQKRLRRLVTLRSEMGPHYLYEMEVDGRRIGLHQAAVGAALAAGLLEEVIAAGCRRFIACGGRGRAEPGDRGGPCRRARQRGAR